MVKDFIVHACFLFYAEFHFQALAQQKLCLQKKCKEALYLLKKGASQLNTISTAVEEEYHKEGQAMLDHDKSADEKRQKLMRQPLHEIDRQQTQKSKRMLCGKLVEINVMHMF